MSLVFSLFYLLVVVFFHFCFSYQNYDNGLCMDYERQALLEFKHGLIDEADRLASWVGDDSDCCRWDGIACDNYTGHVDRIHLPGLDGHCDVQDFYFAYYEEYLKASKLHKLRGDLSPSLLRLKQLTHLDLSCNDFGGIQVPSFISSLGELRYLNLSNSGFGGVIPSQLGNLSKLHVLSLGNQIVPEDVYRSFEATSLSNMNWLSGLRLLTYLDLNGVDLNNATNWFQVINTLSSLVELHLSRCKLSLIDYHIPTHNLTSLTLLDLSYNFLNSSVPRWIFSITTLVSLDLNECNIHSPVPSNTDLFINLTALHLLHVSGNPFMNSSSVLIGLSSSVAGDLILLDISSCGISSSVLDSLHNLTSLRSLDLSYNQLTETIPKSLGNLCNLRDLDMSWSYKESLENSFTYFLQSFFECKSPAALEYLVLDRNYIVGVIPDCIGQLSCMRALTLSNNQISGPIPFSIIGRLLSLDYLDLSRNQLHGSIPDSLGQLSKLVSLDLSHNQLNDSIPDTLGQLSKLGRLDLSYNQLNGSIPDSLGQLSKLVHLDFSYNLLEGVVTEAHFDKLVSLKSLHGEGNNLILRPQLSNWTPPFQVYDLYLKTWGLGPQFPLWILLQKNLAELDISNTGISDYLPESFWRSFTSLIFLVMSQNRIQGTLLCIPSTLLFLDLSSNEFGGKLTHLFDGMFLYYLDLSNNFFVGSLHHFLCSNGVKETIVLNLGNNNLSVIIPECWERWPHLEFLNLNNNNLSGGIPSTLGSLSGLGSLSMSGNKLSGRLPASLMNLTNLVILELSRNEFVGSIPTWLGTELSGLRLLNLRTNNFHGNIPHELCYLTTIQILDLADNNLSGSIPRCISNFSVLSGKENISDQFAFYGVYFEKVIASDLLVTKGRQDTYSTILGWLLLLDLSGNNLLGHIPSELMTLVMLMSLNLSSNQLTGRIPEKIGNMKKLESFDLSLNKLSGELPVSLSSLNFLSNFNVSYNNLTGRIPSGTQLQGFNESCFFGNKLCGDPLTELCAAKEQNTKDQHDEEGSHETDWGLIISALIGLVAGFWIVVAPLIVTRSWRTTYFRFLSKLGC